MTELTFIVILQAPSILCFETGTLTGVELIKKPMLAGQHVPGNCLPLPTQCLYDKGKLPKLPCQLYHMDSEAPKSVPPAGMTDTLPAEPSPNPAVVILDTCVCACVFRKTPSSFSGYPLSLLYPIMALSHT